MAASVLFQFQYGSIGRGKKDAAAIRGAMVSIPVWFDWKLLACTGWKLRCGFNSSMVRLEGCRCWLCCRCRCVSIPVWFDWKKTDRERKIPRQPVSIPVWFDWKLSASKAPIISMEVSIPVWFDWKLLHLLNFLLNNAFQFQYGSIRRPCHQWL